MGSPVCLGVRKSMQEDNRSSKQCGALQGRLPSLTCSISPFPCILSVPSLCSILDFHPTHTVLSACPHRELHQLSASHKSPSLRNDLFSSCGPLSPSHERDRTASTHRSLIHPFLDSCMRRGMPLPTLTSALLPLWSEDCPHILIIPAFASSV